MRVDVDADRCVAAGQCVLVAPAVFDQDDDGIVVLLDPSPAQQEADAVAESARLCPAAAITVTTTEH